MVVGEGQILGQTRDALRLGQELGTVGPALNALFQQALRVGKRAHAETDIDRAAPSLVSAGLDQVAAVRRGLAGKRVVVVGAGSMASLAVATARPPRGRRDRRRQPHVRARRPASPSEYAARALPTGRPRRRAGRRRRARLLHRRRRRRRTPRDAPVARGRRRPPLAIIDLALPHDVDPAAAELPGRHR